MTDPKTVKEHTEALRDAANQLADRVDHVATEVSVAKVRLGRKLEQVGEAMAELGKDAERPAKTVARALDDLTYEARRSLDRITRPKRSLLDRLAFWR